MCQSGSYNNLNGLFKNIHTALKYKCIYKYLHKLSKVLLLWRPLVHIIKRPDFVCNNKKKINESLCTNFDFVYVSTAINYSTKG